MLVVPSGDTLSVEIRIPSTDIDQMKIGARGILRFTAFNQRTTPEVEGVVTRLSPDAVRDKETGQFYYTARIVPDSDELARLTDQKLVPGDAGRSLHRDVVTIGVVISDEASHRPVQTRPS